MRKFIKSVVTASTIAVAGIGCTTAQAQSYHPSLVSPSYVVNGYPSYHPSLVSPSYVVNGYPSYHPSLVSPSYIDSSYHPHSTYGSPSYRPYSSFDNNR